MIGLKVKLANLEIEKATNYMKEPNCKLGVWEVKTRSLH